MAERKNKKRWQKFSYRVFIPMVWKIGGGKKAKKHAIRRTRVFVNGIRRT